MFRGREIVHKEIGQEVLMRVVDDLKDLAVVEQTPAHGRTADVHDFGAGSEV